MHRFHIALIVGFVLSILATPGYAATFKLGSEDRLSITNPVNDDHYIAGGLVDIEENIKGDVFVGAGEVTVIGDIAEDLTVVAGNVRIEGTVGDDVRVGGGEVTLFGSIADDIIVTAGSARFDRRSTVGGDVVLLGGELYIDGSIAGSLKAYAGSVHVGGDVFQDVSIDADKVFIQGRIRGNAKISADEIVFAEGASINGNLNYWTPLQDQQLQSYVDGTLLYDESLKKYNGHAAEETARNIFVAAIIAIFGYSMLVAAFVILLFILITKKYLNDVGQLLQKSPWKSALYGFLYLIAVPVVALLLMITIVGLPLGLMLVAMYIFQLYFAFPITALAFTGWIVVHYKKKWSRWRIFFLAVGCYIALKIISLIPIVGWLLAAFLVCEAFGAFVQVKWSKFQQVR